MDGADTPNKVSSPPLTTDTGAPDPRRPASYSRRILLAVTGLSPQIVTETLYALAARPAPGKDTFAPTEIVLISTQTGKREAELNLLAERDGWFHRLLRDYQLPEIKFERDHILVLRDAKGEPLDDIRTPVENEQAADFITEQVRQLTEDTNSALHVSIAGGRKTMGYYLGYALSLYGRPQDRLSHVLVSEPYEGHRDFFYPTPYEHKIHVQRGGSEGTWNACDAKVDLAEIPFVRLRDGVPTRLLEGRASFGDTVNAAQRALEPPQLTIDLKHRTINAAGESISIEPADLALYAVMARRRMNGQHAVNHRTEGLAEDYLAEYAAIVNPMSGDYERIEKTLRSDDISEWFEQRKSKTIKAIKDALGETLARAYLIEAQGKRPNTRFGLTLEPPAIHFANKLAGCDGRHDMNDNRSEERMR